MVAIKVEIDGQLLDRSDCIWMEKAPCGCISGVAIATYMPMDEDAAWADFAGGKRAARSRKSHGFTFELRPRSDLPRPWNDCPHKPKWGGQ